MNSIWTKIKTWFASKGGFSHVVVAVYLGAVAAYAAVPAFAAMLNSVYGVMPAWLHSILLAAIGVIAWYRNTDSPAGTLAKMRTLRAKAPDAPDHHRTW